jgi:hypothetical protein
MVSQGIPRFALDQARRLRVQPDPADQHSVRQEVPVLSCIEEP